MKNEFKQSIEPTKQIGFQPTKPSVMKETIGRDASEHTRRAMPIFEDATITFHQPHIAFIHTLVKANRKGGFVR